MNITKLSLQNFGKFSKKSFDFDNTTYVVGKNASGKSTILNAIMYLCHTPSRDPHVFRKIDSGISEESIMSVAGTFKFPNEKVPLKIRAAQGISPQPEAIQPTLHKKHYFLNEITTPRSQILPFPAAVKFSPDMVSLFSLDPSHRRLQLLTYIRILDSGFVEDWNRYKVILQNRNKLIRKLKDNVNVSKQIQFWDEKILPAGKRLIEKFTYWTSEISKAISNTSPNHSLTLSICSEAEFTDHIQNHIQDDILYGYTRFGPHLFQVDMLTDSISIKDFGSRGQSKIAVITLTRAFCNLYQQLFDDFPILLLDDLESELDSDNLDLVHQLTSSPDQQKIITMLISPKSRKLSPHTSLVSLSP